MHQDALKKILAGLGLATLLAGAAAPGCATADKGGPGGAKDGGAAPAQTQPQRSGCGGCGGRKQ